ncbi:MAG: DUF2249 domain-containing protein [Brachybacterium sp.]|nr:DUF2249 domain-containing protein [Brachybacterium sp. Z12]
MTQNLPFPGQPSSDGHQCTCSDHEAEVPRLNASAIPHAIRHAAVFGALDAIRPGFAMDLVAPHDPKPLLAQAEERYDGDIDVKYLVSGPEEWVLRLTKSA